jgi:hypothetical protein
MCAITGRCRQIMCVMSQDLVRNMTVNQGIACENITVISTAIALVPVGRFGPESIGYREWLIGEGLGLGIRCKEMLECN